MAPLLSAGRLVVTGERVTGLSEARRLRRRDSRRDKARAEAEGGGVLCCPSGSNERAREKRLANAPAESFPLLLASRLPGLNAMTDRRLVWLCAASGLSPGGGNWGVLASAMHSSVKLRHNASALRRSCRSMASGVPFIEEGGGFETALCVVMEMASASVATVSSAWYASGDIQALDLASACLSSGWGVLPSSRSALEVIGDEPSAVARLGDEDMVVTVVVAVLGRSPFAAGTPLVPPPALDCGMLHIISSLRMRELMSPTSSHRVDGAVVEMVDSVPPCWPRGGDEPSGSYESVRAAMGEELYWPLTVEVWCRELARGA